MNTFKVFFEGPAPVHHAATGLGLVPGVNVVGGQAALALMMASVVRPATAAEAEAFDKAQAAADEQAKKDAATTAAAAGDEAKAAADATAAREADAVKKLAAAAGDDTTTAAPSAPARTRKGKE